MDFYQGMTEAGDDRHGDPCALLHKVMADHLLKNVHNN